MQGRQGSVGTASAHRNIAAGRTPNSLVQQLIPDSPSSISSLEKNNLRQPDLERAPSLRATASVRERVLTWMHKALTLYQGVAGSGEVGIYPGETPVTTPPHPPPSALLVIHYKEELVFPLHLNASIQSLYFF